MDVLNKKTIVTDISKFCGPALISLAFAVLSLVGGLSHFLMSGFRDLKGLGGGISSGLMGGLWSLALQYLCQHDHTTLAWIILFIPAIFAMLMFMIVILGFAEGMENMMKMKIVSSKISTHHSSSTKTKNE